MQTGDDEYTESICRPRYHTYKRSVRSETYTGAARVECRRVSISMGAIYNAAYGTLSRRVGYAVREDSYS